MRSQTTSGLTCDMNMVDVILAMRQNLENIYNTQRETLVLMRDMAAVLDKFREAE